MTTVDPSIHDLAIVEAFKTLGHPVGYGEAPRGALDALIAGTGKDYIVVYPIAGGSRDGSSADPFADAELAYQFTCVARSAHGARWLVGKLEGLLANLTIVGRSVCQVIPEDDGAVRLDTDVKPDTRGNGVHIATPRYRLSTTPA